MTATLERKQREYDLFHCSTCNTWLLGKELNDEGRCPKCGKSESLCLLVRNAKGGEKNV